MTRTPEFYAQYPKDYGPGYRAVRPDYDRCAELVADGGRSVSFHQCSRKNGHGPHGAWCRAHDPVRRKAEMDAKYADYTRKMDERRRLDQFREECTSAIRAIADGHNDPRGLALEILRRLEGLP